jgi:hypothetical protein
MSGGHSSSRRRAYGRRRKDLRHRPHTDLTVDLDGPEGWHSPWWDTRQPDAGHDPHRGNNGPHRGNQAR